MRYAFDGGWNGGEESEGKTKICKEMFFFSFALSIAFRNELINLNDVIENEK